jgi:6,7-dimethyl-8-ribityllumazine synthase
MAQELTGRLDAQDLRGGLIVSQFNEVITSRLADGARKAFTMHGGREESLTIVHVPGSFELPQMAREMAKSGQWDVLVALGCVVRGETAHFDFVAGEAARGIAAVASDTGIPVTFGVLATENVDQAMERSGGIRGNRGFDAMEAGLKMVSLIRQLNQISNIAEIEK